MNLTSMDCPKCGGKLQVSNDSKTTNCDFCGSSILIEGAGLLKFDEFSEMFDFTKLGNNELAIVKYKSSGDAHLIIPEKVDKFTITELLPNSFGGHLELRSVTIPKTIKIIRRGAFTVPVTGLFQAFSNMSSMNLSKVVFNEGLEVIESNAFSNCPLTEFTLPKSLKTLADDWMGSKLSQAVSFGAQGRKDLAEKALGPMASGYTEHQQKFSLGGQDFKFNLSKPINVNLSKRKATTTLNVSWVQGCKDYLTIEYIKNSLFGPKTITEKIQLTDSKKHSFEIELDDRSISLIENGANVSLETTVRYIKKSLFKEEILNEYFPSFKQKIKSE